MKSIGSQSLDQKFKRFVLQNWEKLVMALAFVGVGAFCWFGYVKPYDKTTPTKLRQNVDEARRYIQREDSWNEIAEYRKANDQSVEVISAEKVVDFQPYAMTHFSGTKAATRGLRTDPEIKVPMEASAKLVTGSVLIKRPEDAPGVRRRDWWSELITIRRNLVNSGSLRNIESGDDVENSRLSRRGTAPAPTTEKKAAVDVIPDLMRTEYAGLSPSKLGLNTDDHTTLVATAVAVTGLFPHELQVKEFEHFKGAIKYNELRDQPYYVYLQVERRKRVDGKESEWEDITRAVTDDLLNNVYAATAPEIVEEAYVDPYLTVKIPPFVWMDYRKFSASSKTPVITEKPLVDTEVIGVLSKRTIEIGDLNRPEEVVEEPAADEEKVKLAQYKLIRFFDMSVTANEDLQYRFRVWLADPNDPRRSVYDRVWNKQQTDGSQAGNSSDDGGEAGLSQRGSARGSRQNNTGSGNLANAGNPYDLTFMDVAPAVRTRLKDLDAQPELPEPLAFLKYALPSEWSEPTEWVRIPIANSKVVGGRVETGLQQSVAGVTYSDDEPLANVVVKKWDPALQVQVPVPRKVLRSAVMNFRSAAKVVNPIDRQIYDLKRELLEQGTEENGAKFATNALVVDMFGGQKMPFSTAEKTYYEPSEILVLHEDGRLVVQNELDDRMEFRHGIYADDELLTDVAPTVKVAPKREPGEGAGRRGSRGRTP